MPDRRDYAKIEATLKRLRRKGDSIALEAANPAYQTRVYGPDQVQVQGKLVDAGLSFLKNVNVPPVR